MYATQKELILYLVDDGDSLVVSRGVALLIKKGVISRYGAEGWDWSPKDQLGESNESCTRIESMTKLDSYEMLTEKQGAKRKPSFSYLIWLQATTSENM